MAAATSPSAASTAPMAASRPTDRANCGPIIDRKSTRLNSSHTVIYTLSLHDALPILTVVNNNGGGNQSKRGFDRAYGGEPTDRSRELWTYNRSEEHTSELQSHSDLHSFPTRRSSDLDGGQQQWRRQPVQARLRPRLWRRADRQIARIVDL